MASQISVHTRSGNGLVHDGTKPLPGSMLTCQLEKLWGRRQYQFQLDQPDFNVVWGLQCSLGYSLLGENILYIFSIFPTMLLTNFIFINSNEFDPSIPETQLFQNLTLEILYRSTLPGMLQSHLWKLTLSTQFVCDSSWGQSIADWILPIFWIIEHRNAYGIYIWHVKHIEKILCTNGIEISS